MSGISANDDDAVRALYGDLIRAWNTRDASAFAPLFVVDGSMVGFDGSIVDGQAEIARSLGAIFADHQTPTYVYSVQQARFHTPEMAALRSAVGMPTLPDARIDPTLNAIQSLVMLKCDGAWRIVLFQTTPAQFHGRPDLVAQMAEELQRALDEA